MVESPDGLAAADRRGQLLARQHHRGPPGGASVYGGRGSFAGAVVAAFLLTEILNVVSFLNLNGAWQYWFPGVLVLAGGAFFVRGSHRRWPVAASAKEASRDLVRCENERSRGAALTGTKAFS